MKVTRFLFLLLAFVTACISQGETEVAADDSPFALIDTVSMDVALAFDDSLYSAGEVGTVTVENNTDREIAYHLGCQSEIEGDDGEMWVHVYRMDCSHIRVRPTRLSPGESARERFEIPLIEGLEERGLSQYRVRLNMDGDSYFSKPFNIVTDQ